MNLRSWQGAALSVGLLFGGLSATGAQTGDGSNQKAAFEEYTIEMRDMPWKSVWEWLTDKTGKVFNSGASSVPGSLNFIGKKGRKYTMPQIIDIINDGLHPHKWVLLDRGRSFTLFPADEKIPPDLLPVIDIDELPKHGDTEIVRTVYRCKTLVAEDSAPEVKKQMGSFGEITPLKKANSLMLQDTVANLKQIKKELDYQEGLERLRHPAVKTELILLSALDATSTAATLKGLFPDAKNLFLEADPGRNALIIKGSPDLVAEVKSVLGAIGENKEARSSTTRVISLERGSAAPLAEQLQEIMLKLRPENPVRVQR
jgi:hypothetical protein